MTKRKKIWISVAVFVFITVIAILYSLGQIMYRLERVNDGFANPNFPYRDYTVEELGKLYPQERNNDDVPTIRTPEETHALFIEKLKAGDIDGAVECCFVKGDQAYMKEGFNFSKSEGRLQTIISEIESIKKSTSYFGVGVEYDYMTSYQEFELAGSIRFKQNNDGVWLMERF